MLQYKNKYSQCTSIHDILPKELGGYRGAPSKKKVIFYPLYYTSSAHIDKKCDLTNEAFNKIVNSTYEKSISVLFSPHFFLTYF